jgi:hypothetical protein
VQWVAWSTSWPRECGAHKLTPTLAHVKARNAGPHPRPSSVTASFKHVEDILVSERVLLRGHRLVVLGTGGHRGG